MATALIVVVVSDVAVFDVAVLVVEVAVDVVGGALLVGGIFFLQMQPV